MTSVLKRGTKRTNTQRHREESDVKAQADIGVLMPQVKEQTHPPEVRRGKEQIHPESLKRVYDINTLILDFSSRTLR